MKTNLFHDDVGERAKIDNLIEELRSQECFNYDYFNDVYKICVKRKREKILGAIKWMDNNHVGFLDKSPLAEKAQLERMVLYTYYLYLEDDDAYREKAFVEFLKKRMEGMDKACEECWGIHTYLEGLYKHSDYRDCTLTQDGLWVYQRHLWREFFGNSEEYLDIIPCKEKPPVLYTDSSVGIPRFVFEPPYVDEYSEQEFYVRFMKEWDITHYNPLLYENLHEHYINLESYRDELGDKPEKAYHDYQNAVIMFRKIHNMSNVTIKSDKNSETMSVS